MTVRALIRGWNDFFFKPQSPTPVALFRILYGLLTIINLLMLRPGMAEVVRPARLHDHGNHAPDGIRAAPESF